MLKAIGLPSDKIYQIFQATTLSKLLYASSAWIGFLNSNLSNMIEVSKVNGLVTDLKTCQHFTPYDKQGTKNFLIA